MDKKIFYYYNHMDEFKSLLIRLRNYKFEMDLAVISYYSRYIFNKTSNRVEIIKVKNKSNSVLPKFLLIIVLIAAIILLPKIKEFTLGILSVILIVSIFFIGLLKVIHDNKEGSNFLHIFDLKNKIYIDENNREITFDYIYGFFINYGRLHYQLNMILENGTVHHIITQNFTEKAKSKNRTVNGVFIPVLDIGDEIKIVQNLTEQEISDEYHNMTILINHSKTISKLTNKPLYDFKGKNIRKFCKK